MGHDPTGTLHTRHVRRKRYCNELKQGCNEACNGVGSGINWFIMRNVLHRMSMVMAHIVFLMFALGLWASPAQACTQPMSANAVVMAVESGAPCQGVSMHLGAEVNCGASMPACVGACFAQSAIVALPKASPPDPSAGAVYMSRAPAWVSRSAVAATTGVSAIHRISRNSSLSVRYCRFQI